MTDKLFDAVNFSRMVKYHQRSRRLTGRAVARMVGISPATYSRVTCGHAPDVETYLRLKKWMEGARS